MTGTIPESATGLDRPLELLLTRHSVGARHLVPPGPDEEQLWLAALAALRAPDHEKLIPFRFLVIGEAERHVLGGLYEDLARHEGRTPAEIAAERERALHAPTLVAAIVRIDESHPVVPAHEQWLAAGGALSNFVMALHFMGFGAKMVSGRKARDPAIARAFCTPGETLVGWIAAGTPVRKVHPRYEDHPAAVLSRWTPGE